MTTNLATSPDTPNALPSAWIDRLFERFAAMYGKHWFDLWADVPMADVKAAWRADLAKVDGEQIRKALEHCKAQCKFPPTLPEFVGLCKAFALARQRPALPDYSRAEIAPEVLAEIAKMFEEQRKAEPDDWARNILKLHAEGRYDSFAGLAIARRALGIAA
jgi:hypothetical protein